MKDFNSLLEKIKVEVKRQDIIWGDQKNVPDDRWLEIVEDEFRDMRWAVKTCSTTKKHTTKDERLQLISSLIRWALKDE